MVFWATFYPESEITNGFSLGGVPEIAIFIKGVQIFN